MSARFQSTPPAREATSYPETSRTFFIYFNPRFPRGKRRDKKEAYLDAYKFQSTLPAGEATSSPRIRSAFSWLFQSTLPVWEATHRDGIISSKAIFQSTLLAREATSVGVIDSDYYGFQSTLPAGKRPGVAKHQDPTFEFQSTLPAEEATISLSYFWSPHPEFQSTLPAGEETISLALLAGRVSISIHASRGGSDFFHVYPFSSRLNFNPRFPRGKRRLYSLLASIC